MFVKFMLYLFKNVNRKIFGLIYYIAILLPFQLLSQNTLSQQKTTLDNYFTLLSPEKVYLHTDKDVYFAMWRMLHMRVSLKSLIIFMWS